jgi:hypothetical protein
MTRFTDAGDRFDRSVAPGEAEIVLQVVGCRSEPGRRALLWGWGWSDIHYMESRSAFCRGGWWLGESVGSGGWCWGCVSITVVWCVVRVFLGDPDCHGVGRFCVYEVPVSLKLFPEGSGMTSFVGDPGLLVEKVGEAGT